MRSPRSEPHGCGEGGAVVYVLATRRAGDAAHYRGALDDPDHRVLIEAVRALVSIDDAAGVARAAGDANREVRIAAVNGLATLAAGIETVRASITDPDPLVSAAALGALGVSEGDVAAIRHALKAPAWQVREGAAHALSGLASQQAVSWLAEALTDPHLDVRKAAVISLNRCATDPTARDALTRALTDRDADVRAYARRALASTA